MVNDSHAPTTATLAPSTARTEASRTKDESRAHTTTQPATLTLTCPVCRREIASRAFATPAQRATAHAWLLGLWRMHAAGQRHPYLLALIAERSEVAKEAAS